MIGRNIVVLVEEWVSERISEFLRQRFLIDKHILYD